MKPVLPSFLHKLSPRHWVLVGLLLLVVLVQHIPAWGACYARTLYPLIARPLSFVSGLVPLAVGDLFIASSLLWMVAWPFYARLRLQRSWRQTAGRMAEYLLWLYAWFYLAWGLNYSQPNFYQRTGIAYTPFEAEQFEHFASDYIDSLNAAYLPVDQVDKELVRRESIAGYRQLAGNMGVHTPFRDGLRVKTMLFSPFISMVGVTGSMGPFFCEFTVNADVLPADYPATYAHEMSHLLGITSEAEARNRRPAAERPCLLECQVQPSDRQYPKPTVRLVSERQPDRKRSEELLGGNRAADVGEGRKAAVSGKRLVVSSPAASFEYSPLITYHLSLTTYH